MAKKRTAEELDDLTADEREAIEEADAETEASAEAAEEIAEAVESASKADDKSEAGEAKDEGDGGSAGKEAAAEADEGEAEGGEEEEADPAANYRLAPKSNVPEDAEAKLADIDKREDALAEQFDNGDITAKELTAKQRDLANERHTIRSAMDRAQIAEDMRKDAWFNQSVPAFMADHEAYSSNVTLRRALDREVRELQVRAGDAGRDPFDPAILTDAHKNIVKAFAGLTGAKADDKADEQPDAGKLKVKPRGKTPPTLAKVPAADHEDTDGDEFAALDRLADKNPEAYEDAIARLPEHERERYLRAQ